jgi:hypothetical protein
LVCSCSAMARQALLQIKPTDPGRTRVLGHNASRLGGLDFHVVPAE